MIILLYLNLVLISKIRDMEYYTAYYRVSSQKQGRSGLGLAAQEASVNSFLKGQKNLLNGVFKEVESGRNNYRPELEKAIKYCKKHNTTLLIAKLDRLSRSAAFIFQLKEDKVNFICCDMPEANTLTIGIFATLAQYESELISQRTKAALAVLKAKGVQLGKPENLTLMARKKAWKTNQIKAQNNPHNRRAKGYIKQLRNQGLSYQKIAGILNEEGFKTAQENSFLATTVRRLWLKS